MPGLTPSTRPTISLNDSGSFTKTITEKDVFAFADASGDQNPLHINEEYAKKTRFGQRVAHGILMAGIISTVLGGEIPGLGTIFVELHIRFLKPVFFGDTITANALVSEIINPKRLRLMVYCVNQEGKDVAIGNAIVIPPEGTEVIA
ncbi:MAG: MaoC family dehydratase [Planctomycetota bacterium]